MGRRRTGTRHGNVYRSVREKQEIVTIFIANVGFTKSGISRARPPENRKHESLARSQIFAKEKNSFPERAAELEPGSRSTPKRRLV